MTIAPTLMQTASDDQMIREAVKRLTAQAERVRILRSQTATAGQLELAEDLLRTMQRTVRAMYLSRRAAQRYRNACARIEALKAGDDSAERCSDVLVR
jgi:hypothetical protein